MCFNVMFFIKWIIKSFETLMNTIMYKRHQLLLCGHLVFINLPDELVQNEYINRKRLREKA